MKFEIELDKLRKLIAPARETGDCSLDSLVGIADLREAQPGDLSFFSLPKYREQLDETQASVVLVPLSLKRKPSENQLYLHVENPSLALAQICDSVAAALWPKRPAGIDALARVGEGADVDPSAYVGPFCVIEAGATIGPGCQIHAGCYIGEKSAVGEGSWFSPNVTLLSHCSIGQRARFHPGVVIGADGFGYEQDSGGLKKVPQVGNVVIGDDVEIGANSNVDRGRFGSTQIGSGTKIDNLVQVGHNARIGNSCILCAFTGIAGSANVEDYVVFGARSGTLGHFTVGKGAQISMASAVADTVAPGTKYGGVPAMPLAAYKRLLILNRKLPDLFERVGELESKILGNS